MSKPKTKSARAHKLTEAEKTLARRLESACFSHVDGEALHAYLLEAGPLSTARGLDETLQYSDFINSNDATYASTSKGETFGIVYVAEHDTDANAMTAIAQPSAILESTNAVRHLLYVLDGTNDEIAEVRTAIDAHAKLFRTSDHFMTPLGDTRLIGEAVELLGSDLPLVRYAAPDLLAAIRATGYRSIEPFGTKIILTSMPQTTLSLCDEHGENLHDIDSIDEASQFIDSADYHVHLVVRDPDESVHRGIVVKVSRDYEFEPASHRKGAHFVVRSTHHIYYVHLTTLRDDEEELVRAYRASATTGPVEILTHVPLPYGEFSIAAGQLKGLLRHSIEYDSKLESIYWALNIPVDLAQRFHDACLKHTAGKELLYYWGELGQETVAWNDGLEEAHNLLACYPKKIQLISTDVASSNGKTFALCYHSSNVDDFKAMMNIAEPSYILECDDEMGQLIYLLSGPERDIAMIRDLIDGDKTLGETHDRIWTPLTDTQLSPSCKLGLIRGDTPNVYGTADLINRLKAYVKSPLADDAAQIILRKLNIPRLVLCDQHGQNETMFDNVDDVIAAATSDLSHVKLEQTGENSCTFVVVVSDAKIPYPEVPGGFDPPIVLYSEAHRYSVYVVRPGESGLDVMDFREQCTADWVSVRNYFPLPIGDVRMYPNDLKNLWLSDSVRTDSGGHALWMISEAIDLLLGKVPEGPNRHEE